MSKPHKWKEAIHAWANGEDIQWKYHGDPKPWRDWKWAQSLGPDFSHPSIVWRAKPKPRFITVVLIKTHSDLILPSIYYPDTSKAMLSAEEFEKANFVSDLVEIQIKE